MPEAGSAGMVLPETLASAVKIELGRAFSPPYEALFVVIANGLLMTGAWFLLPPTWLFRFHGALAFPMILASWMYSDVPATNVLGSDPLRSIAALETRVLRRILFAKNLALWLLVVPVCVGVAIGIGISDGRLPATLVSSIWIAVVPLGALGASAWVGIWFPYHPLGLRHRWEHRTPWKRMILRWSVLIVIPYGVVPFITVLVCLPTLLIWYSSTGATKALISDSELVFGTLLACAIAIPAWIGGHALGWRMAERRKNELVEFLRDDDRG